MNFGVYKWILVSIFKFWCLYLNLGVIYINEFWCHIHKWILVSIFEFWCLYMNNGVIYINEFWCLYLNFGVYKWILVSIFKFWCLYLNFGVYKWILVSIFEFWCLYLNFGVYIWILVSIFEFWCLILNFDVYKWILLTFPLSLSLHYQKTPTRLINKVTTLLYLTKDAEKWTRADILVGLSIGLRKYIYIQMYFSFLKLYNNHNMALNMFLKTFFFIFIFF